MTDFLNRVIFSSLPSVRAASRVKTAGRIVLLFCLLSAGSEVASGDTKPAEQPEGGGNETVSFEEAKEKTLSASPELNFSRSALGAASSHISPLITDRIPSLVLSYSGRNEYEAGTPFSPFHSMSLGIEIRLMDGGRTLLKNRVNKTEISEARLNLKKVENALTDRVAESFSSALLAEKRLSLLQESYASAFRHLGIALRRLSQGKITEDELSSISLKVRKLGLSVRKAELSLLEHRSSLITLTGEEAYSSEGKIKVDYVPFTSVSALPREELIDSARQNSPDSIESGIALERAEISAAQQRRKLLPSLSLFSSITFTGSDFPPLTPEVTLGFTIRSEGEKSSISYTGSAASHHYGEGGHDSVSARFPLYSSGKKRKISELRLDRMRREHSGFHRNLAHSIERRYNEIRLIESERDILRTSLAVRERSHRKEELLYRKGQTDLSELLESRRKLTETRIELYQTAVSLFLSEYRLLLFCGMDKKASELTTRFFLSSDPEGDKEEIDD
ncbi:MAG: TolC family protein [Spirochaetia bacterium]